MSQKYAIFVTMQLKPGMGEAFRPHIMRNAEITRREDKDNHAFHVLVSDSDPDRYHFFEIYTDQDALTRHRESAHFKDYVAATADMVQERTVQGLWVQEP